MTRSPQLRPARQLTNLARLEPWSGKPTWNVHQLRSCAIAMAAATTGTTHQLGAGTDADIFRSWPGEYVLPVQQPAPGVAEGVQRRKHDGDHDERTERGEAAHPYGFGVSCGVRALSRRSAPVSAKRADSQAEYPANRSVSPRRSRLEICGGHCVKTGAQTGFLRCACFSRLRQQACPWPSAQQVGPVPGRIKMRQQKGHGRTSLDSAGHVLPGLGALTWATRYARTRGGQNGDIMRREMEK